MLQIISNPDPETQGNVSTYFMYDDLWDSSAKNIPVFVDTCYIEDDRENRTWNMSAAISVSFCHVSRMSSMYSAASLNTEEAKQQRQSACRLLLFSFTNVSDRISFSLSKYHDFSNFLDFHVHSCSHISLAYV